jgi:hypothetical protein
MAVIMPHLANNPKRDIAAHQTNAKIEADVAVAALFAVPPLAMDEYFADPLVRMRIGTLITRAMKKQTKPRRRDKSR